MTKFIVHLREKNKGELTIEAESSSDAIAKTKRLIHMNRLPSGTMEESSGIMVTFVEEV
jgi:hypothetical protein